jgi:uncharacterized membrane protein YiaA
MHTFCIFTMSSQKPSVAFVGASWLALVVGITAFLVGLSNAVQLDIASKGYYFTVLFFALFSAVSVQKTVRDRMENVRVTSLYYGLSWSAVIMSCSLLVIGLWNANNLDIASKGFYAMSFVLSIFSAIAVQKNTRDASMPTAHYPS